jgi:prepilin-type N-terminal cleavage/methylation domain-containing protein
MHRVALSSRPSDHNEGRSAFTLIEAMVALIIIAIAFAGIFVLFNVEIRRVELAGDYETALMLIQQTRERSFQLAPDELLVTTNWIDASPANHPGWTQEGSVTYCDPAHPEIDSVDPTTMLRASVSFMINGVLFFGSHWLWLVPVK